MALFSYLRPFAFQIVARPRVEVTTIRAGVTEIGLKDGRSVRVSLVIKDVRESAKDPANVDLDYEVVAEIEPFKSYIAPEHATYQ